LVRNRLSTVKNRDSAEFIVHIGVMRLPISLKKTHLPHPPSIRGIY